MAEEAKLEQTEHGLVRKTEGWYTCNLDEVRWMESERFGRFAHLEGGVKFPDVGMHVHVLTPGQPACMYHREKAQENFFVLSGECLLLIDGQERHLRAWDFVHCAHDVDHVFIGAGDGPCSILMIGARPDPEHITYPRSELALKHGAGVETETNVPKEAYEGTPSPQVIPNPWNELKP